MKPAETMEFFLIIVIYIYIYISVNLGRIFSLINVRLNDMDIFAFTYLFSSVFMYKIRYLQKLEKKIVKANIAILLNRTCINIYIHTTINPLFL